MYGYPFPAVSMSTNVTTNYPATSGVAFQLEGLEEFNNYTISVAAVNSNGTGPYTANITLQTQPDGKYAWREFRQMGISSTEKGLFRIHRYSLRNMTRHTSVTVFHMNPKSLTPL